jgi:hypothetical protein
MQVRMLAKTTRLAAAKLNASHVVA